MGSITKISKKVMKNLLVDEGNTKIWISYYGYFLSLLLFTKLNNLLKLSDELKYFFKWMMGRVCGMDSQHGCTVFFIDEQPQPHTIVVSKNVVLRIKNDILSI